MIAVPSIETVVQSRIFGSMQVYFEGVKNLNWLLGMIESNTQLAAQLLLSRFAQYSNTQRFRDLQAALN
jgi:hypothetical protein